MESYSRKMKTLLGKIKLQQLIQQRPQHQEKAKQFERSLRRLQNIKINNGQTKSHDKFMENNWKRKMPSKELRTQNDMKIKR